MLKVVCKIWLDNRGKAFGEGPYALLKRVEKTRSLHEAAQQMGMSYSKAWTLIRTLEKRLGFSLLDRKVGGISGGGSVLTPDARGLMRRYDRFRREADRALQNLFQRHFRFKKGGNEE